MILSHLQWPAEPHGNVIC